MDINRIDLNLLQVLRVVYETRSVSAAGRRLAMTQSAVSNALRRLRGRLDDPLFVRSSEGMLPTTLVESIIGDIEAGLGSLEAAMNVTRQFDAAKSDRLYRILANDIAQLTFIPRIIKHLAQVAPHVCLETVDASFEDGKRRMLGGSIDLALGNWPAMGADYFLQRLFSETFVVLMSRKHRLFRKKLTKTDYFKARHVDYHPGGATYFTLRELLDKMLAQEGLQRHVTFTAGHSLGLATIIAESDLLLTLPARLAASLADGRNTLGVKPLPFPSPPLKISQQWHARVHRDPGAVWFRRQIEALFSAR